MQLWSTAFTEGSPIPHQHTGDGKNTSPFFRWSGEPPGTQSFALICEDPDATHGLWVHWVIFNLPADRHELHADVGTHHILDSGARQGTNDFHRIGYGGPAPPPGKPHRYFFRLYALKSMLDLHDGATRHQLLEAMREKIVAQAHLMGTYQRDK